MGPSKRVFRGSAPPRHRNGRGVLNIRGVSETRPAPYEQYPPKQVFEAMAWIIRYDFEIDNELRRETPLAIVGEWGYILRSHKKGRGVLMSSYVRSCVSYRSRAGK